MRAQPGGKMKKISLALIITFSIFVTSCQSAKVEKEVKPSIQINIIETTKKEISEETLERIDNFYYKDATSLEKKAVEDIAKEIKEFYLSNDFKALSTMIDYPIYFDKNQKDFTLRAGGKKVSSAQEFLECVKDLKVSEESAESMKNETCVNMFVQPSTGGICFGDGHIWMRDINFDGLSMKTEGIPKFKIFALSGLE